MTTETPQMNGTTTDADAKATEILRIIEKYGLNYERTGSWDGFDTFLPIVKGQVSRGESIKMLLPGFPFKSPNDRTKVLGKLPDLGEELAMKRLDSIASAIDAIYPPGAEVHITSDGLVYNGMKPLLPASRPPRISLPVTNIPRRPPRCNRRNSLELRPSSPRNGRFPRPQTPFLPPPLGPTGQRRRRLIRLKRILSQPRILDPHRTQNPFW